MYKQQLIWNTYWNHWNTFTWTLLLFHTAHSHGQTKEKEMKFKSAHYFLFFQKKKSKLEPFVVLDRDSPISLNYRQLKGYLINNYLLQSYPVITKLSLVQSYPVIQVSFNCSSEVLSHFLCISFFVLTKATQVKCLQWPSQSS